MGLVKEFREFAVKGNVIELAIAVLIGAAFGAIVTSLVENVITPLLLTPLLDKAGIKDVEGLSWGAVKYGKFLSSVISFLCIAFVLFFFVKGINTLKEKKADAPKAPELTLSEKTLLEIRDSLKK